MKMIGKGFRFGLLLQFAVGPMSLLVFNTSANSGLLAGLSAVAGITLIDALYIALAAFGLSAVLKKKRVFLAVKVIGAAVLALFGANMIMGAFGVSLIPSVSLFSVSGTSSPFATALIMTASNPLTIVFWGGAFTTQIAQSEYAARELAGFGLGCVLSSLCFLSFTALLGIFAASFLSPLAMHALNAAVGALLIFFAARLAFKQ